MMGRLLAVTRPPPTLTQNELDRESLVEAVTAVLAAQAADAAAQLA